MKNSKIWNILAAAVLVLQMAAETLTIAVVMQLDMLPAKYLMIMVLAFVLLLVPTALLLLIRIKGTVSKVRMIIACVLALLIVAGCGLVAKVAGDAYDAVSNVTNSDNNKVTTSARDMYIFVRTEDPAKKLSDLQDYVFATIENYNTDMTEKVLARIEESVGKAPEVKHYGKNTQLVDALFAGEVDALIMNGATTALLLDEATYGNFFEKVKILEQFPYESLKQPEETQPEETRPDANLDITQKPFAVYISGSDTRSDKLTVSRSDVNILMIVNPVTKQVLLVNTPRDCFVPNPAGNGVLDKLTHCGLYGVDCSMEALGTLYNTQIEHYGQINFTGFETLIDAMGGINIYSDKAFLAQEETYIQKGDNLLSGKEALDFARERYNLSGGDHDRGKNQMKVIKAVIEKITNGTTIISNYSTILESLTGMFTTDLEMGDISKLVKMQLTDMAKWDVFTFAITGTGASEITYSAPGMHLYVMYPDEKYVEHASQLIQKVMDGELLQQEDLTVPK